MGLKRCLQIAAGSLLLVTGATALARQWWFFDLFTHFRVQYAAIAALFCLGALAMRAHVSALLLFLIAIYHGGEILPFYLPSDVIPMQKTSASLQLITANVLDTHSEPQVAIDVLLQADADLLVVVEAFGAAWPPLLGQLGDRYPHRAPLEWTRGTPIIILSKFPLQRIEATQDHSRLTAQIALCNTTVSIVGVNLASPSVTMGMKSRRRNRQLEELRSVLSNLPDPVIVAGDFNVSPWSPHYRDFIDGTKLRNVAAGHRSIATWPAGFWPIQVPIDHVLAKGEVIAAAMERGPAIGSDHYPLFADLRIGVGRTEGCRTIDN
jgi:endonuclease/exonuclease/phosphatase (EEP) superfamily protein YafD